VYSSTSLRVAVFDKTIYWAAGDTTQMYIGGLDSNGGQVFYT